MTSSSRLAYDDFASPQQMHADCEAVGHNLHLERAARAAVEPAPARHREDFPREVGKRDIRLSAAAARLANALHLHLD